MGLLQFLQLLYNNYIIVITIILIAVSSVLGVGWAAERAAAAHPPPPVTTNGNTFTKLSVLIYFPSSNANDLYKNSIWIRSSQLEMLEMKDERLKAGTSTRTEALYSYTRNRVVSKKLIYFLQIFIFKQFYSQPSKYYFVFRYSVLVLVLLKWRTKTLPSYLSPSRICLKNENYPLHNFYFRTFYTGC